METSVDQSAEEAELEFALNRRLEPAKRAALLHKHVVLRLRDYAPIPRPQAPASVCSIHGTVLSLRDLEGDRASQRDLLAYREVRDNAEQRSRARLAVLCTTYATLVQITEPSPDVSRGLTALSRSLTERWGLTELPLDYAHADRIPKTWRAR